MKKVLMITDLFPPERGGRSEKMAKRVKYLFKYGWETEVLTPLLEIKKNDGDTSLLEEVPKVTTIHRTGYFLSRLMPSLKYNKRFLSRKSINSIWSKTVQMIFIPQGYLRWFPYAITRALTIMREKKIDVIYTMNNPVTLHMIGYFLKKITKKPWLVEFRDPWAEYSYATRGPKAINRFLERKVVECADRVVWYDGFLIEDDYFYVNYPALSKNKFVKLPFVGYNPEDFKIVTKIKRDKFRIFYAGSFYGETNTPVYFLKALKHFLHKNKLSEQQVEVVFAGDWCEKYTSFVKKNNLQSIVKIKGFVSRANCVKGYNDSDVLLLIMGVEKGCEKSIPSKFWDYVGAGKVILALSPHGAKIAHIIREQNLGIVANPIDIGSIVGTLEILYKGFCNKELSVNPSAKFLGSVNREHSEKMFAEVLNTLVNNK